MKKLILCATLILTTTSCNMWNWLEGEADILEAAYKCLHAGDYACAIAKYNQLADGTLKSQKLCTGYLTKAGISTSTIIDTMQESSDMLGHLANSFLPWNSTKEEDTEAAITHCAAYKTATTGTSSEDNGKLLSALALMSDCAMRMSKTDTLIEDGASNCDTTNNTPTTGSNGVVDGEDISVALDGSAPGMCSADALICRDNLQTVSADLNDAGAGDLDNIPGIGPAIVAAAVRTILMAEVAP